MRACRIVVVFPISYFDGFNISAVPLGYRGGKYGEDDCNDGHPLPYLPYMWGIPQPNAAMGRVPNVPAPKRRKIMDEGVAWSAIMSTRIQALFALLAGKRDSADATPTKMNPLTAAKVSIRIIFLACSDLIVIAGIGSVVFGFQEAHFWQRIGVFGLVVTGLISGISAIFGAMDLSSGKRKG